MSGDVLLRCDGVGKRYGGVHAVSDVSIEVRAGEVVALIGPNGAGKTTLIDLITGQQPLTSGRVMMGGRELTGPPSRRARRSGFARTFQHPLLAMDLTVRENIRVGMLSDRFRTPVRALGQVFAGMVVPDQPTLDQQIDAVAAELHLEGLDRLCSDLTLGEQRIAEVARALVRNPAVLMLDEPFAGGDANGVRAMAEAVMALRERSCGVLVVDHNVDIVAQIADRVVLLNQGQVAFEGTPQECLDSDEMREVYFGGAGAR